MRARSLFTLLLLAAGLQACSAGDGVTGVEMAAGAFLSHLDDSAADLGGLNGRKLGVVMGSAAEASA